MRFNIIFISGVHGVGKGTICGKLSSHIGCPHYSASDLIRSVKNTEIDENKIVIEADKNQDYLITALDHLNLDTNFIIVDGHFCLQGDKVIIEIPLETFESMKLTAIVLLTDEPTEIYRRMHARDYCSLSVDVITNLQEREKERARYVASSLEVPILEAGIDDYEKISEWVVSNVQVSNS